MLIISRLAGATNLLNRIVGEAVSWFSLAIVFVCFTVVFQRYVLGVSYLCMQDLCVWPNGANNWRRRHPRLEHSARSAQPARAEGRRQGVIGSESCP
jgi:hypothetical protein